MLLMREEGNSHTIIRIYYTADLFCWARVFIIFGGFLGYWCFQNWSTNTWKMTHCFVEFLDFSTSVRFLWIYQVQRGLTVKAAIQETLETDYFGSWYVNYDICSKTDECMMLTYDPICHWKQIVMNNDKWLCEYCKRELKCMQNNTFLGLTPLTPLSDTGVTLMHAQWIY